MNRSITALAAIVGLALVGATPALAFPPNDGDLFVTEEIPGDVHEFIGASGAFYQTFTSIGMGASAMAIHTGGANGNVLVGSVTGGVRQFDRTTGALINTINPGGGWQWAGIWRPSGTILVGDQSTNSIKEYNPATGALIGGFAPVPMPADMLYGPNGNVFVCSFLNGVFELDGTTGAFINQWAPGVQRVNDILFMPDGRRIITSMSDNLAHVFDTSWNQIATFSGTGWARPHGIALSPHDGRIYVVDGVTQAVHSFDPTTYAEISASFLSTATKPVDLEFRPAIPSPGALALLGMAGLVMRRRRP